MDNFTSCEEYFVNLRTILRDRNATMKHFPFPDNKTDFWGSRDIAEDTKLLAYAVIMVVGLLGNLSVIVTIVLIKSVRNAINFYVTNLAVADAMICIICMLPHALSQYTKGKFIFGAFMCKFTIFTQSKSIFYAYNITKSHSYLYVFMFFIGARKLVKEFLFYCN